VSASVTTSRRRSRFGARSGARGGSTRRPDVAGVIERRQLERSLGRLPSTMEDPKDPTLDWRYRYELGADGGPCRVRHRREAPARRGIETEPRPVVQPPETRVT